jgi:hypothetical protein
MPKKKKSREVAFLFSDEYIGRRVNRNSLSHSSQFACCTAMHLALPKGQRLNREVPRTLLSKQGCLPAALDIFSVSNSLCNSPREASVNRRERVFQRKQTNKKKSFWCFR